MTGTPRDIVTRDAKQALANVASDIDSFQILDIYKAGATDERPRIEALATVSAGYKIKAKNAKGEEYWRPVASRREDQQLLHLHDEMGRALGLKTALEATNYRSLTIAFPFDKPQLFIQQRYAQRTATELKAYGDEREITIIQNGKHVSYSAGTEQYERVVSQCKVETSIYFCLAIWESDGPAVIFPDAIGSMYRLRFTSRNSLRSIVGTLKEMARFTDGRIAGIPFTLTLDFRQVSDGEGKQRIVPVFVIAAKPPETFRLDSRNFQAVMSASLAQGQALMLRAPRPETIETARYEVVEPDLDEPQPAERFVQTENGLTDRKTGEIVEGAPAVVVQQPTEQEAELLARGGHCDAAHWTKRWHAVAKGTRFEDDAERHHFVGIYTCGNTPSLAAFLANVTEQEAASLIAALEQAIADDRDAELAEHADEQEAPAPAQPLPSPDETDRRRAAKGVVSARCMAPGCEAEIDPAATYLYKGKDVTGQALLNAGMIRAGQARCVPHLPDRDAAQVGGK